MQALTRTAGAIGAATVLILAAAPAEGAREGELVPFFTARDASGGTFDLRAAARKNTVLVLFWDSYKAMAVRELNFLNDIYGYYHLYGLEIVAVEGKGKDSAGLAEELDKLKTIGTEVVYPVVADPGGRIKGLYRVDDVPETFLLSRRGEILYHLRGFRQEDGYAIDLKVKELLGLLPDPERVRERDLAGTAPPRRSSVTVDPEQQIFDKHFYFGNYYYNLGEKEKALGYYLRCVEVMPQATEVHLVIGQIHADGKRYEEAREAWEKILKYDPDNKEADAKLRQFIRGEF